MNQSLATANRVQDFKDDLHKLYDLTNNYRLQQVIEGSTRATSDIVAAITSLQNPKFSVEDVEGLIASLGDDGSISPSILGRLQAHELAYQLLEDYALIRGAEIHRRGAGEKPYFDWTHVQPIDTITTR